MTPIGAPGGEADVTASPSAMLTGAPLQTARVAGVFVHGRGQDEQVMLDVIRRLALDDVAYALPTALGRSWYPNRYFEPLAAIEPHLSSALDAIDGAIDALGDAGIPDRRIVLCGFSQGACLAAQLAATRPRRFAGVAVLTGSLLSGKALEQATETAAAFVADCAALTCAAGTPPKHGVLFEKLLRKLGDGL